MSIPEPLSMTFSVIGWLSSPSLVSVTLISVAPAWSELSINSATALDVPL